MAPPTQTPSDQAKTQPPPRLALNTPLVTSVQGLFGSHGYHKGGLRLAVNPPPFPRRPTESQDGYKRRRAYHKARPIATIKQRKHGWPSDRAAEVAWFCARQRSVLSQVWKQLPEVARVEWAQQGAYVSHSKRSGLDHFYSVNLNRMLYGMGGIVDPPNPAKSSKIRAPRGLTARCVPTPPTPVTWTEGEGKLGTPFTEREAPIPIDGPPPYTPPTNPYPFNFCPSWYFSLPMPPVLVCYYNFQLKDGRWPQGRTELYWNGSWRPYAWIRDLPGEPYIRFVLRCDMIQDPWQLFMTTFEPSAQLVFHGQATPTTPPAGYFQRVREYNIAWSTKEIDVHPSRKHKADWIEITLHIVLVGIMTAIYVYVTKHWPFPGVCPF